MMSIDTTRCRLQPITRRSSVPTRKHVDIHKYAKKKENEKLGRTDALSMIILGFQKDKEEDLNVENIGSK